MNGAQFKAWRHRMGWTQVQAAAALGLSESAIEKYENDRVAISRPIKLACRWLSDNKYADRDYIKGWAKCCYPWER